MNNEGFSKLESLIVISIIAVFVLIGFLAAISQTNKKKIETFKKETINIVNIAKNVYSNLEKEDSEYIIKANNSEATGVCITLSGLKENDYLTNEYKKWDGYIVIEKDSFGNMRYTTYLTNGKYIIDGYTHDKISGLSLKDETLLKGKKIDVADSSFKGAEKEKGGISPTTSYNGTCINEKIE